MYFVKTKKWFGIFMLLFLGVFFVGSRNTNNVIAAPTASTTDLTPVADEFAYISNTLTGDDEYLSVGGSNVGGTCDIIQRRSFLKFDLSTLPPGGITNVSLTLHSVNYQASTGLGTLSLNLFGDTDDMWNEGLAELVWAGPLTGSGVPLNVAPVPAATVGNNLVFSTTPAFISYLESNRAINGGNDRATIYIEPFACGTLSILELASKDNTQADPVPTLSVTTASILYVETGGDNARACTDSANPCATIAGAYGKANSGDIIEVLSEGTVETSAITCTREITLRGSGSGTMPTISAAFGGIGFFNINAGCDMTVKGLTIDEGTAFLMFNQSGGLLVAYANNFVWDNDFGAFPGHTSTGGIALLRGNWLGAAFPTDQFSNTTPEVNDYRLGAPVQEWADGVGGSAALLLDSNITNTTPLLLSSATNPGGDIPVIVNHGRTPANAPFGKTDGSTVPCSSFVDMLVVNTSGSQDSTWNLNIPLDNDGPTGPCNTTAGPSDIVFFFDLLGTGAPNTSCVDTACWNAGPSSGAVGNDGGAGGDWSIIVSGMNENHLYGTPGAGGGGPMGNLGPTVISLQQISSNQSNPVALNIMIIGIIMLVILSFGAIGYRRRNR